MMALPMMRARSLLCLAFALALPAAAQVAEDQKLLPSEASEFGSAVALVETETEALALVGAPDDSERGDDAGALYAYRYDEAARRWEQEAKLWPEAVGENSLLGGAVAISADGRFAVVGGRAAGSDMDPLFGRAFVFRREDGMWVEEATLGASDEVPRDGFGAAVALSADGVVIAVGAPGADGTYSFSGAVYVFRRDAATGVWAEEAKLSTERQCFFTAFGAAVDISAEGNRLVVGEPCGEGGDPPALYFFARLGAPDGPNGGWAREALFAPMAGSAVALSAEGDLALAGAWQRSVVVFERSGGEWTEETRISASTSTSNLGRYDIALRGNLALIGDVSASIGSMSGGAAFLFRRFSDGTWAEAAQLVASDGTFTEDLGWSVAFSEGYALAGDPRQGPGFTLFGAAYAYDLARVVAAELPASTPDALVLGAYPNPFVTTLTVTYALPRVAHVRLAVFDVLGREVAVLADERQAAGPQRARFEAQHLPAGVYLVRLEAGGQRATRRVARMK